MPELCGDCTNPTFCQDCRKDRVVVTTPITRAFDVKSADGTIRHIIVGYGVLLNELDSFGTALSRELVEGSIPLLRKYPAVRYMHHEPFGRIVFDEIIEGFHTQLDDNGFFVVAEIGANFEKEFSLIRSGGWGFSWGMFPTAPPVQKEVGGKTGQVYEKGRVYEISVVDVPSQPNASITVIRGKMTMSETEKGKTYTKEEFDKQLLEAEKRITDNITRTFNAKNSATGFDTSIKEMEQRLQLFVERKLAEQTPEKSRVDHTFEGVNTKLSEMDQRIVKLKGIEKQMKTVGEDTKALSLKIAVYEKQRETLVNTVTETVEKTLGQSLGALNERVAAIENSPDLHSPATLAENESVNRGMGFIAMVEAARKGTPQ